MDRRIFLGLMGAGAAAARGDDLRFLRRKAGLHPYRAAAPARRPHVFVITLDMVSPDHWHPSRSMHKLMETPHLKRLMAESVSFTNAFTTAPLCAPARAALATGRYTYITANGERAHDGHETILRPDDVIFQEYLKATGYRTKHAGKGHLGTQKFMDAFDENDSAWDRWAPPIEDDEQYLAYIRRLGVKPQRYSKTIAGLQQDRKTRNISFGGWIEQEDGKPFPYEAHYTRHLVERAKQKLDAALTHNDGSHPVYLQLDIFDPHQPFSVPAGFERRQALRAQLPLPVSYERVRQRDWARDHAEPKIYGFYRRNWGLYDPETVRDYRYAHALQMEVIDRALGELFGELKRRGLYDESLIAFTADHGEMNGRQALVDKGVYLHPDVLRVPLAIKPPASMGIAPRLISSPVSHLDIAPTLLETAGVRPEARLDGVSLWPLLKGEAKEQDRELLFECGWHVGVNFACAFQRWEPSGAHWLYVYNCSDDADELYDLNAEDAENLAARPQFAAVRRDMIGRLGAFLERDPRWIGYWHSLRVDRYHDLPRREEKDPQMFKPVH